MFIVDLLLYAGQIEMSSLIQLNTDVTNECFDHAKVFCYPGSPFVPGSKKIIGPTATGVLDGLTFAVKDLIDVRGAKTGCGNPQWLYQTTTAEYSAPCVEALLQAGAQFIGKTITDEFAFSLEGINDHYTTPLNPCCPNRMPGGSSSGSASVVAQGFADLALGTDTGGSVRVPAAFCGVYGIRPTYGEISLSGTMPFAPSYDTIGWFARNPETLQLAAGSLLPKQRDNEQPFELSNLYCAIDAFALAAPEVAESLWAIAQSFAAKKFVNIFKDDPAKWLHSYQVLQGREIWETLGKRLVVTEHIMLTESVAERFSQTHIIDDESVTKAQRFRTDFSDKLIHAIPRNGAIIIPTSPNIALNKSASKKEVADFYAASLTLNSIAGHAGLPQVCIPAGTVEGCPVSLSLIGHAGDDIRLIATARIITRLLNPSRTTSTN